MLNGTIRDFVLIGFGFGSMTTAHAGPEWGIDVTGDSNTACELKKPFRISTHQDDWGDIWVGFYVLREESSVAGYTLPANEVILIIKTEQDLDDIGEEYDVPSEAYVGETQLKKYQFDAHVVAHAFFFVDGASAQVIFDLLTSGKEVDVRFDFENNNSRVLKVSVSEEDRFEIFAAMFLTCGEAIRT